MATPRVAAVTGANKGIGLAIGMPVRARYPSVIELQVN
jgi:NAD(P)-dependent dehydrogenase (short-subunit alcohol dehydrogenase family)